MDGFMGLDSGGDEESRRKVFQVPISSLLTDDCACLKRKFVEKNSPTFSSFRECWEDLSFHTIYKYSIHRDILLMYSGSPLSMCLLK